MNKRTQTLDRRRLKTDMKNIHELQTHIGAVGTVEAV